MSAIQQALTSYWAVAKTYATWNPSDINWFITLSNWNLTATSTSSASYWKYRATIWKSSGKWYWEITHNDVTTSWWQDWVWTLTASLSTGSELWNDANAWVYREYDYGGWSGDYWHNASFTSFTPTSTPVVTDVFWYALDMDAGILYFYKNNILQSSLATWITGTIYPMASIWVNTKASTANFWATTMAYTAPSGYNQWLYN